MERFSLEGLTAEEIRVNANTAKFDLTLTCEPLSNGVVQSYFEFNTDLFKRSTIEKMVAHFQTLLHHIVDNPYLSIDAYNILTNEELNAIHHFNDTQKHFRPLHYLHEAFQTFSDQQRTAVKSSTGSLTYQALERLSTKIAVQLRSLGVLPNQLVAVIMEKGWEQVAAVLGILKSGAAYLPINPAEPERRLQALLEQSDARILLTQKKHKKYYKAGTQVFTVDDEKIWVNIPNIVLENNQTQEDLAYVIFTSGSTGAPKGVMISHESALNTIQDINDRFYVTENDCILGLSALNFDLSVYDIFGALSVGAQLLLPDENETNDPTAWYRLFQEHKITIWNSTPGLMEMFVSYIESTRKALTHHSLRLVLMSGDWISPELPDRIRKIFGDITLISMGGATEGSIWSIIYPIKTVNKQWQSIPYGMPMANQQFYVFNEQLQHCPIGVSGELYIGGRGVAAGYWRDPERTAIHFITHPETHKRLYRTGDLGRYSNEGYIEFLGRVDFQVKIRGYRVELGEIEAKLKEYGTIKDALVIAQEQHLIAYYVTHNNKPVPKEKITPFIKKVLPSYMMPTAYIHLEKFPMNHNGKIDRNLLPLPLEEHRLDHHKYIAPTHPDEINMVTLWSTLLNVKPEFLGITHDFFTMGGHSLLASRLIANVNEQFQSCLSVRDLFENPTIDTLLEALKREAWLIKGLNQTQEEGIEL